MADIVDVQIMRRKGGADEGDAAMRRLSDRRRAEVMESNTLPQMQAVMNRV